VADKNLDPEDKSDDKDEEAPEKNRHFVTALARGLDLLGCFKPSERFLGNQQIAQRTGLPKPTVSRLTYTLTQLGYLNYSDTLGKYSLGTAVLSIGNAFLSSMHIRQVARPLMQDMADATGASVALASRDRLNMIYLESCRSTSSAFVLNLDVGSLLPIATSSIGRAYLCGLPEHQLERVMDQLKQQHGDDWSKIKLSIEEAIKEYQTHGFCLSIGEWKKDVNAVAVPFIPIDGSDVLSFNCGGPAFNLRRHMLEDDIGPQLVALVNSVQAVMNRQA
jgi:DNA-binding IclR family transcriptional regulator